MTHLHSPWSSVLEPNTMESLVEVDGVLSRDDLTHGGGPLFFARHLTRGYSASLEQNHKNYSLSFLFKRSR